MGQRQSNAQDGQSEGQVKVDYYELLGVDRQATDEEIKKAYRKKALELHPDRNYGNVEDATRLFAEIQSAYEILSDPQERAWYDSHRDTILRGDDASKGAEFVYNVRLTTAEDILGLIARFTGRVQFTDAPTGFFGGLRETFEKLAREEELACEWEGLNAVDYPSFGHKEDTYEDVVKQFYAVWNGFATKKPFAWKDHYRLSDAPDRSVRRLMEKENKRLREEAIREFNNAVRSLVAFVRKRDPRFKPNSQSEADRQRTLRQAAQAQAARSRAANQAKLAQDHVVPDWAKSEVPKEEEPPSEEESELEHYECVVCNKTFKSEKQFHAHEKSKKHIKSVKELRRDMRRDNKILNLDDEVCSTPMTPASEEEAPEERISEVPEPEPTINDDTKPPEADTGKPEDEDEDGDEVPSRINPTEPITPPSSEDPSSTDGDNDDDKDDYAPREHIASRMTERADISARLAPSTIQETDSSDDSTPGQNGKNGKKVGKAKQKRAKKAAAQQKAAAAAGPGKPGGSEFKCAKCQAGFPSKTRLFNHIKELGHAHAVPVPAPVPVGGKKSKGGKGRDIK